MTQPIQWPPSLWAEVSPQGPVWPSPLMLLLYRLRDRREIAG
jgi:hypothetical protein